MNVSEVEVFGPILVQTRKKIEAELARLTSFDGRCPAELEEAIRYSLLSGGKRLRPLLVLAANRACGGSVESAMPVACAVEMIHTYSLIHDDLPAMDDDDIRRGQPSCHAKFSESTAILAGDALIPMAFETIVNEISPPELACRCVAELATAAGACQLVGGQFDDLRFENSVVTNEQLESIHNRKTGALFTTSLRLGGICATAEDDQLLALTEYGKNIGLAFQVTDDLLDLCGEEAKIGKRVGKDSSQGKRTYPELMGEEVSRNFARQLIERGINALGLFGTAGEDLRGFAKFVADRNF